MECKDINCIRITWVLVLTQYYFFTLFRPYLDECITIQYGQWKMWQYMFLFRGGGWISGYFKGNQHLNFPSVTSLFWEGHWIMIDDHLYVSCSCCIFYWPCCKTTITANSHLIVNVGLLVEKSCTLPCKNYFSCN